MPSEPCKLPLHYEPPTRKMRAAIVDGDNHPLTFLTEPLDVAMPMILHAANTLPEALRLIGELREALEQARLWVEGDETTHGRKFGTGNAIRAALARADKFRADQEAKDAHDQ